jgi:hypothetical protein
LESANRTANTAGLSKVEGNRQRLYLFAGMGGLPARRKHRAFLLVALLMASAVCLILVGLFYWINAV